MKIKRVVITIGFSISVTAIQSELVGTWASKSAATLTGASFYNPVEDIFMEPTHTGISYSFTADGFFEEAYYRAISNPTKPSCPKAILQFQHGTYSENPDGSLVLTPFSVDGRKLVSDPCSSNHAVYTRYNQTEIMKKYEVHIDPYTKMTRLDLYQFDGTKLAPMYLAYNPPQMLPTVTLNPTTVSTSTAKNFKRMSGSEKKWMDIDLPLNKNAQHVKRQVSFVSFINPDIVWWSGITMMILGGAIFSL
ncbi:Protein rot1 [Golovinomyces cichoracearum]|uniref:Protein ROT1 n=1 Tax=Golovinomyces cichoracearum TaxID=62708 RepID=A0A420J0S0_9PEZI|nr:Protein rot1 [Golovinomyces cichoracearum]